MGDGCTYLCVCVRKTAAQYFLSNDLQPIILFKIGTSFKGKSLKDDDKLVKIQ